MLALVACMGTATPQASFQQSGGKNIAVLYHLRGDGGGSAWTVGPGNNIDSLPHSSNADRKNATKI